MSKNPVGAVLAVMAMLGFMATVILLGFVRVEIPDANRDFFNLGFGALISITTMGVQFFLGSSKSSADKTEAAVASSAVKDQTINNLTAPPKQ